MLDVQQIFGRARCVHFDQSGQGNFSALSQLVNAIPHHSGLSSPKTMTS